jgi:DNA invertase Pin-like site-specific DNA recombinase
MNKLSEFIQLNKINQPISNRKNAIIYTRVSTKEQANNNTSLQTQKMYCEHYAMNNNLSVIANFGGTYESAKSDERKEFQKMIHYAKQNKSVGKILVYSFDRFSRTGANAAYLTGELNKIGIQVISVTQLIDTSSAGGVFQQNLFYLFSQFENEMRRDKTTTAMKELLRKGYWLWTPPRGYQNLNKHSRAIDWEIVLTKEGELLRKAFEWRVNNSFSSASIVRRLNFLGMKINEKRILDIFKNPFYCGMLVSSILPNEAFKGKHEAIISIDDYIKINSKRNIQLNRIYNSMSEDLPLKKLAVCSQCNYPLTGFLNKQKNIYYYRCQKKCLGETINATKFNEAFVDILSSLRINKSYVALIEYTLEQLLLENMDSILADPKITNISLNDLKTCINRSIYFIQTINENYKAGDVFEKHKLQQIVFPGKISFNKSKNCIEIKRLNSVLELILIINKELNQLKYSSSNAKMPNYTSIFSKVDRSLILDDLLSLEQLITS